MNYIRKTKTALWKLIKDGAGAADQPIGRIKSRTSKRAKEEAQYRKRKKEIFRIPRWCEACEKLFPADSVRMAEDIHHRRGRAYRLLNYEPEFVLVCRCCHKFIHDNPEDARHFGLLCEKGQWNKQPKD